MNKHRVILRFQATESEQPIIYYLVKEFDLMFNIIKAVINPQKEGMMVLELTGSDQQYQKGIDYLKSLGISIQPLSQEVQRDEQKCTHCGACTSFCPSGALYMERPSMEVAFDQNKCVICLICVRACPVRAMEVNLNGVY